MGDNAFVRHAITQFMWGFQPHFRSSLEHVANDVFQHIGFGISARAFLVGFAIAPDRPNPTCFEPELDPLASVDLRSVEERARELYDSNPEREYFITSRRHNDRFHQGLRDAMRAQALREALEASESGHDHYFFVGHSGAVEGYEVHPVIAVPRSRWDSKPALSREKMDRYEVVPSLQHALVRILLRHATNDMGGQSPPEDFSLMFSDRSELPTKAAREFVQSVSALSGYEFESQLVVALNAVSAQPYEGRAGAGGLILTDVAGPYVECDVDFVEPIRLAETRSLRKSLEMTDRSRSLVCDGEQIVGLGRILEAYPPDAESVFVFTIAGRGAWELSHNGISLLRVADTRPTLPRPLLDGVRFREIAKRVFQEVDADRLWGLTQAALNAPHGTMLVVHKHATDEAARLLPQAQRIVPRHLESEMLIAAANIDGAILVDPNGQCHAFGVILDGHAIGMGDASRGARFNSAVRYQEAQRGEVLIIIVSEDGMIDLLPDLRRQVRRDDVERAVREVEETATADPDYEAFYRRFERLELLSFYLSKAQCDRANAAHDAVERHRTEHDAMTISWVLLEPDPRMDDSYFLD